ncbi:MAG: ribosome maturation factor RimP [Gammaproteobacteria bacterium]|nr:ribosome maturation factor RimP [Gammaproteobacteria bacterium]
MQDKRLQQLLGPTVAAAGYELIGVERLPQGHGALLRVYIDSSAGISIDDCEQVSHQISGLLDVEDPIRGQYTLEVSSPGLDRPLFTPAHFEQFIGSIAAVRLRKPLGTRRRFTGVLRGLRENNVLIQENGTEYCLPYEQIDKARLVPGKNNP